MAMAAVTVSANHDALDLLHVPTPTTYSHWFRVALEPRVPLLGLPFREILAQWARVGFDRTACYQLLLTACVNGAVPDGCFQPEGVLRGELAVTDEVLFPAHSSWELVLSDPSMDSERTLGRRRVAQADVPRVAERFRRRARRGATGRVSSDALFATSDLDHWLDALDSWLEQGRAARAVWPLPSRAGLYRREHASVLIRSENTSLLLDPLCLAGAVTPPMQELALPGEHEHIDAILISHGHMDHWHLPSIVAAQSSRSCPVIIPQVPVRSLLSPADMTAELQSAGVEALSPPWYAALRIGDIEVEILPFFGEQPTRDRPWRDPRIRNWGNCYRIDTPQISILVLIDSGADPLGDMSSAVAESVRRRGPVDVVLSCLRRFPSPFQGGLSSYWAPLDFATLQQLYFEYVTGTLPSTTAGPTGVASICAISGARYVLPYAHGFEGLGRPVRDVAWGLGDGSEAEYLGALAIELRRFGASTNPVSWMPGERAMVRRGGMEISRAGA